MLHDYNLDYCFEKAFEFAKRKGALFESIVSKLYRHNYMWIGNEVLSEVQAFLDDCGILYEVTEKERSQSKLVIRAY